MPWGPGGLTLRPAVAEQLALGPSAIAVGSDGAALVLDNWGHKLWRIGATGATLVTSALPADSEDLIAWSDGAFALYRPLSRAVDVFARDGSPRGSVRVPRAVVDVAWLEAGPSRRVLVQDPFQETVTLGSPHAPLDEASVLRSRREGVFGGLEVVVKDGRARLRVLAADAEHKRLRREHTIADGVQSAQIVGAADGVACVRLERVGLRSQVVGHVVRNAVCIDTETGRVRLDVALPPPGPYVPRRELALGGTPLQLVHIEPGAAGLTVRRWEVQR